MSSTRSRRPRPLTKSPPARVGTPSPRQPSRSGGQELAELRRLVQQQRQELDENSTSLAQALARITHSERTLSQTKTKLLATQEQLSAADAQTASLWARLQDQDVKLQHAQADRERAVAETREQCAVEAEERAAEIASLRDALAAALERERTFRRLESELRTELEAARQSETAALRKALDNVSSLAQQLLRAAEDARHAVSGGESERVTMKPQAGPREARSVRRPTGPEILVDGLPLVP